MANFVKIDESKLLQTKGKRIDGMRFYEVDGKAYFYHYRISNHPKAYLTHGKKRVGEDAAQWEMNRANVEVVLLTHLLNNI